MKANVSVQPSNCTQPRSPSLSPRLRFDLPGCGVGRAHGCQVTPATTAVMGDDSLLHICPCCLFQPGPHSQLPALGALSLGALKAHAYGEGRGWLDILSWRPQSKNVSGEMTPRWDSREGAPRAQNIFYSLAHPSSSPQQAVSGFQQAFWGSDRSSYSPEIE